ncbi:MAG: LysR family transcriptional regulator [Chloroflexi bacterium]|nr:LysR family transcriptional regulator [Chloroflexota bacterium]
MINVPELKVFVTAAEELNFSRAAQRLHLSQSAVSQNIQSIERTYRVELFVRHGRSVQLSEAGLAILPMARDVLNSARLLEDALVNVNGEVAGDLTIGCAATSGRYFIPNLLASFQRDYPHVRTRVSLMRRQDAIEGLLDQTLNLGVVGRVIEHRELECQPLLEDRVILIVPAHHPWADLDQVKPADVLEQPFISRETNSGTYEMLFDNLRRHGIDPENLNVVMQLGDAEAVQMAVENGIGITFISEVMASRSLALGRVKKVAVEGFDITQKVFLVRHISRVFTHAETKLWEYVRLHHEELTADLLCNLANIAPD